MMWSRFNGRPRPRPIEIDSGRGKTAFALLFLLVGCVLVGLASGLLTGYILWAS